MAILVLVALLALLVFGIVFGLISLPVLLPMMLFSTAGPQVLDGSSSVIGPIAPMVNVPGQPLGGRPSQFGLGLNPVDAYAACGPTAAIAFARWFGVDIPIGTVMSVATRGLWDAGNGMHGVGAEQTLLTSLRLASHLETPLSWQHVTAEASVGRPVILDTPGHYWFVDAYDAATGRYHVGTSGTDLRGGSDWMTAGQINGIAVSHGAARAAIYAVTSPPPIQPGSAS